MSVEAAARELAQELLRVLPPEKLQVGEDVLVVILMPLVGKRLREVERAALWDVILHLSLELERRTRPGGAAAALTPSDTPD